jgi:prophage regulatory protein
VGKPKRKRADVVCGEKFNGTTKWTASEWGAYVRGYQAGKTIGRPLAASSSSAVKMVRGGLLRVDEVTALVRISRSTLYRWSRRGLFPRPVAVGPGVVGYREREVVRWLSERAEKGV